MKNILIELWYDATLEMIHFSETTLALVICLQIIEILAICDDYIIAKTHEAAINLDTIIVSLDYEYLHCLVDFIADLIIDLCD